MAQRKFFRWHALLYLDVLAMHERDREQGGEHQLCNIIRYDFAYILGKRFAGVKCNWSTGSPRMSVGMPEPRTIFCQSNNMSTGRPVRLTLASFHERL